MKISSSIIPKLSYVLFSTFLGVMAVRSQNETTIALVLSSVLMFAFCWTNANHLLGTRAATIFVLIAVCVGWFAEQMGSSRGWFFGHYVYTDVLGSKLGDVPMIIPLMWFALCYTCYVISNLIIWRKPLDGSLRITDAILTSLLAAMIITAYDLGADPYMVFKLKAWIMTEKDGWWFGETLQGFAGWMLVSFVIILSFRLSIRKQSPRPLLDFNKLHIVLPLLLYASMMVFQICLGYPVETRSIALFAMGIPLLCAFAGWRYWQPVKAVEISSPISTTRLEQMQYLADPLADDTIADILGNWAISPDSAGSNEKISNYAQQALKIATINRQFDQWKTNQSLQKWAPLDASISADIYTPLQTYLQAGQILPAWADQKKIERAETLFMEYGALSCSLLFCSSLPECYVIPDLSAVLHAAGQLEKHTEYRIRATAAMIFPVMMKGGLSQPEGSGVAQILKVRLIHATIRNLILHGSPQDAVLELGDQRHVPGAGVIAARPSISTDSMQQAMANLGWKLGEDGLPCNQEELAYTLLTFGYVFLRSMRKLGLALRPDDEVAFLHAWNVVGHILGIRRELMADNMDQAEALFKQMQERGRADPLSPDPRPGLGIALMNTMEQVIPFRLLKPFPTLMTRWLCGAANADDIGVSNRTSWLSRALFFVFMQCSRFVDSVVRLFLPEFSISRFVTRVLGYHFMSKILMDQTRPLKLPEHLLDGVSEIMVSWSNDPKAPDWLNALENKLTTSGPWNVSRKK